MILERWIGRNLNVVNGNGPCNKQRLAHHKKAHDEGEWVVRLLRNMQKNKK